MGNRSDIVRVFPGWPTTFFPTGSATAWMMSAWVMAALWGPASWWLLKARDKMGEMRCLRHQACPLTEALEMKSDSSDGELRMQLRWSLIPSQSPRGGGGGVTDTTRHQSKLRSQRAQPPEYVPKFGSTEFSWFIWDELSDYWLSCLSGQGPLEEKATEEVVACDQAWGQWKVNRFNRHGQEPGPCQLCPIPADLKSGCSVFSS